MSDRIVKAARSASKIVQGMNEAAMMAKIDALQAEVDRLRKALTKAQRQFRFYADEHLKAGKYEKHATNQEYVMMIDAALKGAPHE